MFSGNWAKKLSQKHDWSAKALLLLAKYYGA